MPCRPACRPSRKPTGQPGSSPAPRHKEPPLRAPPQPRTGRTPRRSAAELEALRYAARCAYTLDHQPVALEQLARQPAFRGVGLGRLRAWCDAEGWVASRQANVDAWRRRAQARLAAHVAQQGHSQRAHLQSLHDQAVALRHQQVVQPRSWEQVAQVQLKTAQLLRQWQQEDQRAMAQLAGPQQASPAAGAAAVLDDVSDTEAQAAAHNILHQRMATRLARELPQAQAAPLHRAIEQAHQAMDAAPPELDHHEDTHARTA